MKIVHISYASGGGGAAIAARRLNDAMRRAGMDSSLITREDFYRAYYLRPFFYKLFDKAKFAVYQATHRPAADRYAVKGAWSEGYGGNQWNVIREIAEADVVYLHWVNNGTLSAEEIGHLAASGKKVIWFLHDMWPLTGGCHYSLECEKYRTHCGNCPMLESSREKDLSYRVFERKLKCFTARRNLTLVSPSSWMDDCTRQSRIFAGNRRVVIPNVINTGIFHPADKAAARKVLDLPLDKKLILFGCDLGCRNFYKGWSFLEQILPTLDFPQTELLVFGGEEKRSGMPVGTSGKIHFLGRLNDERTSLALIYSAADVFVSPSIAESFGLTLAESSACGTPAVCFDVGGTSDVVLHKITGYLAKYKDGKDLAEGIQWVFSANRDGHLSAAARAHIEQHCSEAVVIPQHRKLLTSSAEDQ